VILVGEDEMLNVHKSAGEETPVSAQLPPTATDITLSGRETLIEERPWVEITAANGQTGWVDARYLTEYVRSEIFCQDQHIRFLLDDFSIAIKNKDGDLFASLVSPTHGLDLRYYRQGIVANYTPSEAAWAFKSDYRIDWGAEPGSGFEKIGTFGEVPYPALLDLFEANYKLSCNEAKNGASYTQQPWPLEYTNINFYQLFKPGSEEYAQMDWRSWLVGVEYVHGKPYLFALIHFEWEP
jgi:hypothetical protein